MSCADDLFALLLVIGMVAGAWVAYTYPRKRG